MMYKFGSFEDYPSRYTMYEAWVYLDNRWKAWNTAEILFQGRPLTEAEFIKNFGNLPEPPPITIGVK